MAAAIGPVGRTVSRSGGVGAGVGDDAFNGVRPVLLLDAGTIGGAGTAASGDVLLGLAAGRGICGCALEGTTVALMGGIGGVPVGWDWGGVPIGGGTAVGAADGGGIEIGAWVILGLAAGGRVCGCELEGAPVVALMGGIGNVPVGWDWIEVLLLDAGTI